MTLNKEQINSIKHYLRNEQKMHQYGMWDKFELTRIKIHTDGYYEFRVHWVCIDSGTNDDIYLKGNLFDEFPINAVYDGLDVVQLLMHDIHIKAMRRLISHAERDIDVYDTRYNIVNDLYTIKNKTKNIKK